MYEMNDKTARAVTTEEFIRLLQKKQEEMKGQSCAPEFGVQFFAEREQLLERRHAARITHIFLREICGEQDEADWSAAEELKDLYDCRVCVEHVAQMYVKGIMSERFQMNASMKEDGDDRADFCAKLAAGTEVVFGMLDMVCPAEAEDIAAKVFDRSLRILPKRALEEKKQKITKAEAITWTEAERLCSTEAVMLVDVRTTAEYEEQHLEGAISIPMGTILINPFVVGADKNKMRIMYCERGYQSEIAANCLAGAGYERVYYMALNE